MVVLGIHDGHTAGAAIIRDGVVLAAVSEERLTNIKNVSGPPLLSIAEVLRISGVQPEEVNLVAIGCLVRVGAPYADKNLLAQMQVAVAPYLHSHIFAHAYVNFFHRFRETATIKEFFSANGVTAPIIFLDHHLTHAASAYYQRPWKEDAVIVTLDGSGDGLSATVSVGSGWQIQRIAETTFYDSLSNNVYSEITGYLGMKRWEHEYKIMGLAPYGKDDGLLEELRGIIRIHPNRPLEFQNTYGAYLYNVTKKLSQTLIGRRFDNIAWAAQAQFEELVTRWVKNSVAHTGIHNVVAGGGSFLNVKANKVLRELPEVSKFFVYPAADDGGTPVGAALEGYIRLCAQQGKTPAVAVLGDIYYGRQSTSEDIADTISKTSWKKSARRVKKGLAGEVAGHLAKGKIVARFSGREEWGPRALGNRSILADPRNMVVIQKLNFAIKQRDFWMPFASSVLHEDAPAYFKNYHFSPYMIEAFDTKEKGEELIAGLHPFDRTCRPQSVNDWNPEYQDIIRAFKKQTGVSGLLNTSFNLHGYPIVGNPAVAIETFERSGLDVLVLEDWIIEK